MSSLTLSRFNPRLPLSLTRLGLALAERWEAWRERRRQRLAFEALRRLDPATLRDLGLEGRGALDRDAAASARLDPW